MVKNNCAQQKHKIALYCFFVFSFFLFNDLQAQVTIGSDQRANSGSLLDLKQNTDGTSLKGLGLPRVELKSLKIPKNETSLSITIKNATGEWDKDEHIGLMVYNVSVYNECDSYTFRSGPYAWNGDEWQYLIDIKKNPEVKEYVDARDGEKYLYRRFGNAGEWMLEHLRYIPKAEDYPNISPFPDIEAGTNAENDPSRKLYYYPNSDLSTPGIPNPTTWRPNQGILYTYSAATLGAQDDVEDNQGRTPYDPDAEGPLQPIQGICPPGWHIPNDKEWSALEKEIYNNANKYSQYKLGDGLPFIPEEWNVNTEDSSDWELHTDGPRGVLEDENGNPRPGHGYAMMSQCPPIGGALQETGGRSLSALQGGFDVILSGGAMDGMNDGYGVLAAFWTSSVAESEAAWARMITAGDGQPQQVARMPYGRYVLTNVRCKR